MFAVPETQRNPIDQAIDARRRQLGWRWKDVYDRSGLSQETVRQIRHGLRDEAERTTDSEPRVEKALQWKRGTIQAIRDAIRQGREPDLSQAAVGLAVVDDAPGYPDFVGDDEFFQHIWDYTAVSEIERRGAIRGAQMARDLAAGRRAEAMGDARRA